MSKRINSNLEDIIKVILDKNSTVKQLAKVSKDLFDFFDPTSSFKNINHLNVKNLVKSTLLDSGVAISPPEAASCIVEYMRTTKFLRGVYEAIIDMKEKFNGQKIHLLYAGTGPFATLVTPLLHLFDPKDLEVTFLDIHENSLDNLKALLETLNLTEFVKEYVCEDASNYKLASKAHIILSETMRSALEDEPQVNITLNLLPQVYEGGLFLPQKIELALEKGVGESLCTILDLDTTKELSSDNIINCKEYTVDDVSKDLDLLYLTTTIFVYKDNILKTNESNLNTPKELSFEEPLKENQKILFDYEFKGKPKVNYEIKKTNINPNLASSDKQIRELLASKKPIKIEKNELALVSNNTIGNILSSNRSLESYTQTQKDLTLLHNNLKGIFDFAKVPMELRDRQFLNKTGYAMSPENALNTINDVFRVSGFIRAIDLAIKDLKEVFKDEPLHIVYPACGPLAPLLIPLLIHYSTNNIYTPKDIKITFIDIQQGAIMALVNLLKVMNLDSYIEGIECIDAVDYRTNKDVHLVVLEAMQHGFTKEGHLSIAKHFSDLLHPKGIFLPQNVTISAILAVGEQEYNLQFKGEKLVSSFAKKEESQNQRIPVGKILEVNIENLRNMEIMELDANTRLIECASHIIPDFELGDKQYLMLFTTNIHIYKDEYIDEYDSGITHPLPDMSICVNFIPNTDKQESDIYLNSGDTINFYYKLVGLPGFLVTKGE